MTHGAATLPPNRLTRVLDIQHPVLLAPMDSVAGGRLAAAVSHAGGLGLMGGGYADADWLAAEWPLAGNARIGCGFITWALAGKPAALDAALAHQPAAVMLSFGDPAPFAPSIHAAGAKLICQVQTVAQAREAAAAGADVIVAQGTEAGGHTGSMSLLPLLALVADRHPDVPLLAAGAIADGRSLAGALTAGADGAVIGTSFLGTPEAVEVHDVHKQLIVSSDGHDSVHTRAFDVVSGMPWPDTIGERVRRNRFTQEWAGREAELIERRAEIAGDNPFLVEDPDPATEPMAYGQGAGFVDAIRPAAEVLERICGPAEQILRSRPASML